MIMVKSGESSYLSWARSLSSVIEKTVSKQAIFERMSASWVITIKALLQEVIGQQIRKKQKPVLYRHFKNVWLQDSTSLPLPEVLYEKFCCKIMEGQKKSVAKLNVIVNAISGFCISMRWHRFTKTEQSLTETIFEVAQAGDLVIRDLGYFVLNAFRRMDENGIYYLSRFKYGVALYDTHNRSRLNLSELLKGRNWLDTVVLCGRDEQMRVRLVAVKLPEAIASEKIRKAKQHHSSTTHHSEQYYQQLAYVIFVTNITGEVWSYREVAEAYRIRWNIETIFKSWKSGLDMQRIVPEAYTRTERVESYLYLMLLYIAWFQILVWMPLKWHKSYSKTSIIKLMNWAKSRTLDWLSSELTGAMKEQIRYYCSYDTRHDRLNANIRFANLFNALS